MLHFEFSGPGQTSCLPLPSPPPNVATFDQPASSSSVFWIDFDDEDRCVPDELIDIIRALRKHWEQLGHSDPDVPVHTWFLHSDSFWCIMVPRLLKALTFDRPIRCVRSKGADPFWAQ